MICELSKMWGFVEKLQLLPFVGNSLNFAHFGKLKLRSELKLVDSLSKFKSDWSRVANHPVSAGVSHNFEVGCSFSCILTATYNQSRHAGKRHLFSAPN